MRVSDIYAMGGRPLTALAIAAFPKDGSIRVDPRRFSAAASTSCARPASSLLGGHTVQDAEIKFGYAVTGAIDPARILAERRRKAGRRAVSHQAARHRHRRHRDQVRSRAFGRSWTPRSVSMRTLNRAAADALLTLPVE